jgi:hypothetical protein
MISSAAAFSIPVPWTRKTPLPADDAVTVDTAKAGTARHSARTDMTAIRMPVDMSARIFMMQSS